VYPLINGELAAYRISEEYRTVPRPNIISSSEWERLPLMEQVLYQKNDRLFSTEYKLKSSGIDPEYKNEKYSNSFVMLRHYFTVKKENGTDEKIPFFTLYTNITPLSGYRPFQEAPKRLPFYGSYRFRVNESINNAANASYWYIERCGKKLFPGSRCDFQENPNNARIYNCYFDNVDRLISPALRANIRKENIEFLHYAPSRDDVPVYNTTLSVEIQKNPDDLKYADVLRNQRFAILKTTATFYGSNILGKEKFFEVTVNSDEVIETGEIGVWRNRRVLVRKNALKKRGRLKKLVQDDTISWSEAKGMMIYDGDNASENTREIKTAGGEFELAEPEKLLNAAAGRSFFLLKPDSDDAPPKYILIPENRNLIDVQAACGDTADGVVTPQERIAIGENAVIGYCYQPPLSRNAYYDAVLLFKDIDFMNNQEQYQPVERYFFVSSIELDNMVNIYTSPPEFAKEMFNGPHIFNATGETRTVENRHCIELLYKGRRLYLPQQRADAYNKNVLEWKKFFRVLGRKTGGIGEAFKGLDFIKNNYDWSGDGSNAGAVLEDSNPDWWRESRDEPNKTKSIKRSIVCGHPLEWDKSLYAEGNGSLRREAKNAYGVGTSQRDKDDFMARVDAVDIWTELKGKRIDGLNTNENNFWFAHPVYFIKHLEDAGLLKTSFNPYFGRHKTTGGVWFDCQDNPGFAPVWEERKGDIHDKKQFIDNNGNYYAMVTTEFNWDMGSYYHEGVDFRGDYGKEIKSFVYADVIGCGWGTRELAPYGRTIVLGNQDGHGLYLLGHLQSFEVREGDIVEPGDLVAKVGKSGFGEDKSDKFKAPHLHLSYYDYTYKKGDPYLEKGTIETGTNRGEAAINLIPEIRNQLDVITRDPFKHETKRRF